jgi:putative DNA-invertase from lambdoid prophage Rac
MIVFYARVSTTEQTTAHQRTQAEQAGFKISKVVADEGISGVSTRLAERPEGKRLFDMLRAGDTLVVRWVDRLGRNYTDVVDTVREFMRRGVIIKTVINGMTFDGSTSDPMQQAVRDALIAFMAATAQAQAEATKSAQRAGIDHKRRAQPNAYLGRKPSYLRPHQACSRQRQPAEPIGHRESRALVEADGVQIEAGPAGGVGSVGRVGAVMVARSIASRDFLSLYLAHLNLKRCRTRLEEAD